MRDGRRMSNNDQLLRLLRGHLALRRQVQIQDVYKLLYQGVFGGEHLLADHERARAYLQEEWQRTAADPSEPLTEPVAIDGGIVRANLSRCRAEGFSCDDLWWIFVQSNEGTGNADELRNLWREFGELCRRKLLPFEAEAVIRFGEQVEVENYPARHHSPEYRQANRPAYRIVRRRLFDAFLLIDRGEP